MHDEELTKRRIKALEDEVAQLRSDVNALLAKAGQPARNPRKVAR